MNIRNGLTITCVLLLAALMGCGQRAGDAKLPESKEAKQLLQGVWSGEDTEDVVFQLRGDSVYYPDSTSMPAFFRVYDDTLYIGSSARYHIEKHTNHVLWFKGSDGEMVKLVKGDGDEDKELFERNKTQRHSLQLNFNHLPNADNRWNLKASATYYNRDITLPNYTFSGTQWTSFSELSYAHSADNIEWVGGLNLWTDRFDEHHAANQERDYTQTTLGAFVQTDIDLTSWLAMEAGLRTDYVSDYGTAVLPRLSFLFKPTDKLSSRLGGGLGYKQPTLFTEESERIAYQGVLAIDKDHNQLERSWGANWDVNYTTGLFNDQVSCSINQLFFYTRLSHPLLMKPTADGYYQQTEKQEKSRV